MLQDSHNVAAKMSLDVMITLYRKNVWRDAKTVNVISTACFSDVTKLMVTAVKFFLGSADDEEDEDDDDNADNEKDTEATLKEVKMQNRQVQEKVEPQLHKDIFLNPFHSDLVGAEVLPDMVLVTCP